MNLVDFRVRFAISYDNPAYSPGANIPKKKIAFVPPGVAFAKHGATFRICLAETARPARAHPRNLHLHGGSMDILFFLAVGLPFAFLPMQTALLIAAAGIGILFLLLDL